MTVLASPPVPAISGLTQEQVLEAQRLAGLFAWRLNARQKQLPPDGDWFIWYVEAGRGFGKTRTGAEWIRDCVERQGKRRGGIVGPTISTTRNLMVNGPSGILAVCPPWAKPTYKPSTHMIEWPNGAVVEVFSAEDPDRLRGANLEFGWADEIGTWHNAEPLDMFLLCVRIGERPRICITGTPKPLPHVKALSKNPNCIVVKGSTYENRENLSEQFFTQVVSMYEGTRLGRQEIHAELLEDVVGALWTPGMIETHRVTEHPELQRIVVGVDPQGGPSGETGIVVAGTVKLGGTQHGYVLEDCTLSGSPDEWGRQAVGAYHRWKADRIVYETNYGGDMVEATLRTIDNKVAMTGVRAMKSKQARAEPVSALAEQGRLHHVGYFGALESELTSWVPGENMPSPNRLDAVTWAITELMLGEQPGVYPTASQLVSQAPRFVIPGKTGVAGRLRHL